MHAFQSSPLQSAASQSSDVPLGTAWRLAHACFAESRAPTSKVPCEMLLMADPEYGVPIASWIIFESSARTLSDRPWSFFKRCPTSREKILLDVSRLS